MDISTIIGEELHSVAFVEDYLELRFGPALLTLYHWPYVMLPDFSVAFGEPEYRNALCAQIGASVETAALDEGSALTIEFANGVVLGLSLREEDLDGPDPASSPPPAPQTTRRSFEHDQLATRFGILWIRILVRCRVVAYRHVGARANVAWVLGTFLRVRSLAADNFSCVLAGGGSLSFWGRLASLGWVCSWTRRVCVWLPYRGNSMIEVA